VRYHQIGETIKLWLVYQIDGEIVSGLTNLSVRIEDDLGIEIVNTSLTEDTNNSGKYVYDWNTIGITDNSTYHAHFYQANTLIGVESYHFSSIFSTISTNIEFIKGIEGGRWEIVNNEMIFYAENNSTVLARFELFNQAGQPDSTNVFERRRI
jgi:hypothetical protein